MTIPVDAEIRAMEGPALTRLAYELGLAPEAYNEESKLHGPCMTVVCEYDCCNWREYWQPHNDIEQARQVFLDALPALGVVVTWYAAELFGRVSAKLSVTRYSIRVSSASIEECLRGIGEPGNPAEASAAMAVLRCACLVRAYQLRMEADEGAP